jgi:hypothetical protein
MQVSTQFERSSQAVDRGLVNLIVCFRLVFLKTGRSVIEGTDCFLMVAFFSPPFSIGKVSSNNVAYFMLGHGKLICIKLLVALSRMACACGCQRVVLHPYYELLGAA